MVFAKKINEKNTPNWPVTIAINVVTTSKEPKTTTIPKIIPIIKVILENTIAILRNLFLIFVDLLEKFLMILKLSNPKVEFVWL